MGHETLILIFLENFAASREDEFSFDRFARRREGCEGNQEAKFGDR
ncbi:hypothetical protein Plim_3558 [Planctopirus limnophila DSM 3776]|uniref:Uncharacterized protein n=1 Tax=Planctopirus limnophila (strain ATCC 43296 / DSM 3776 / IFAM 1008 / Mu 290) TaxID=521674 RepID=D5SVL1_PLAL2|nr:hypothetical protein Plim_3558 [Planctopirus limnophila DSM 3776]